jgi:hypothetical protein
VNFPSSPGVREAFQRMPEPCGSDHRTRRTTAHRLLYFFYFFTREVFAEIPAACLERHAVRAVAY